jgi:CRP-like cAMP-binding protein
LLLADHGLADVHGVEPGQVLILGRQEFQLLARQDQLACQMGWQAVIECMKHLADLVESLSFHTVARRVALTLLRSTEKDGDLVRITQSELAAEVGTTREVVARCLAGLRRAGAVKLGRARITVLSREKLQQES